VSQRKIDPIEKGKVVGDVKDRETLALVSTAQATPNGLKHSDFAF
tara:strand:+ start:1495 stop:1629 length:135 start_codon:yes stop_codon:yes gene_type:complete